jgi:hypothetical protein
MSALAAYRTAILALLSDPTNVIFSNTDVDQALRWALSEYSSKRPLIRTYIFTVDATTGVHTLPADFVTRHITKVELWDEDQDSIIELTFYANQLDEQWMINTSYEVAAGEVLQISYSAVHAIDGLDGAAGTTVPEADETLLQVGAAGRSATMRALERIETINMNPDVVKAYRDIGADYISQFSTGLTSEPGVAVASLYYPGGRVF